MKYKLITLIAFISIAKISAQQTPQFTQYMYNMSVVNPAYTTSNDGVLNLGVIHRKQWNNLGPETSSAFVHKAFSNKLEAGISYTRDKFNSFLSNNYANADIAYRLNVSDKSTLSFGIKAGANFYDFDSNGVILEDMNDEAFTPFNKTLINLGAGLYFNTDKFYLGFSVPNFMKSKLNDVDDVEDNSYQEIHYYLTSGYVFNLSDKFKFKPAFMSKYVSGAPLSLDITGNVLFNDRIELGIGYRLDESISGLVNFRVTPSLRIGYAYDHITNELDAGISASHEFILLYDLGLIFKKGYDKSPRFF